MSRVYETIRVREGRIPFLAQHLARLQDGTAAFGIAVRPGLEQRIRRAATEPELVLRVTVAEGEETIEPRPVPARRLVHVVVAGVVHAPYRLKTTHREAFERAREEAAARGADEALLLTAGGFLAEGSITGVAFWQDGLCVPELGLGILPSIGRGRLIELARAEGIAVREGRWARPDFTGRAMLLVNSVRGMMEVETLDGVAVPQAAPAAGLVARFWPSTT